MGVNLIDVRTVTYKGVTITIQERKDGWEHVDYGYKTSNGISGIGQRSEAKALEDAKAAIDRLGTD